MYKKGNIVQFKIDRVKYRLSATQFKYGNILSESIKTVHKNKLSVKFIDIWGNQAIKFITINKSDVIKII